MQRDIFASEHNDFRDMVRAFIAKEVTPYHEKWEAGPAAGTLRSGVRPGGWAFHCHPPTPSVSYVTVAIASILHVP